LEEKGMLQCRFATDAMIGIVREQLGQEIGAEAASERIERHQFGNGQLAPFWKLGIVMRQADHGGPRVRRWGTPALKDLEQLVTATYIK
jgi:hypothetical protein